MTAINVVVSPRHECIWIACDAAVYFEDTGEITAFESKAFVVPAWPGAIAGRGYADGADIVCSALKETFATFDDVIAGLNDEIPQMVRRFGIKHPFELILAGFSKERGGPESWFIQTPGSPTGPGYPPPYTAFRTPNVVVGPTPTVEMLRAATGAAFVVMHEDYDSATVINQLRQMLEMQRRFEHDGKFFVGGFGQLTIITPHEIQQRTLQSWPEDTIGDVIRPQPIDWREWNTRHDLPLPPKLTRNERRRIPAAIGTFNLTAAQKATGDQLRTWIDQKLLDPKNMDQYAAATIVAQKSVEKLAETAAIAGAPLEGLKRLQVEAGSVRTQLDQFAVTSTNAVTPALRDMLLGTTSLSAGFKSLGLTVVQALTDAIIKLTIIKPLISSLTSGLQSSGIFSFLGIGGGGSSINANGSIAGAFGATSVGGAPLVGGFGFHSGGIVGSEATFTRSVPSAVFANAPRFHKGLMADEFPAILQKGESVLTPGQMAAVGGQGSSATPVVMNDNRVINIGQGASEATVAQLKQTLADDRAQFASNVVATVRRAQAGRHL